MANVHFVHTHNCTVTGTDHLPNASDSSNISSRSALDESYISPGEYTHDGIDGIPWFILLYVTAKMTADSWIAAATSQASIPALKTLISNGDGGRNEPISSVDDDNIRCIWSISWDILTEESASCL